MSKYTDRVGARVADGQRMNSLRMIVRIGCVISFLLGAWWLYQHFAG